MYNQLLIAAASSSAEGSSPIEALSQSFHLEGPLFIAQVINFTVVAILLWKFAFKPVATTLEERKKKIEDGLQYAEEMKTRLADAERDYAEKMKEAAIEAGHIVEEARDNAKKYYEKQTQEAVAKAESIVAKGEESIRLERQQMLADLRKEVAELVVATSGKVLGRDLSGDEKTRFSESAAKELYSQN